MLKKHGYGIWAYLEFPANNAMQHKAFDMEHCKLPKRLPKLNLVWTLLHGVNPLVHLEREERPRVQW